MTETEGAVGEFERDPPAVALSHAEHKQVVEWCVEQVDGLVDGSLGFGGEESAGASFLRRDGTVWTTDKDGLIPCLLAAELTARSGENPAAAYDRLTAKFGAPAYRRIDAPATREQKAILAKLSRANGRRKLGGQLCSRL